MYKATALQRQAPNSERLLRWGLQVSVRHKLSHPPQAFEERATRRQIKDDIKVPALNCWEKVNLQVALLAALCALRPQPEDCLEHKGLLSLTFCFSFRSLPVGSRPLPSACVLTPSPRIPGCAVATTACVHPFLRRTEIAGIYS